MTLTSPSFNKYMSYSYSNSPSSLGIKFILLNLWSELSNNHNWFEWKFNPRKASTSTNSPWALWSTSSRWWISSSKSPFNLDQTPVPQSPAPQPLGLQGKPAHHQILFSKFTRNQPTKTKSNPLIKAVIFQYLSCLKGDSCQEIFDLAQESLPNYSQKTFFLYQYFFEHYLANEKDCQNQTLLKQKLQEKEKELKAFKMSFEKEQSIWIQQKELLNLELKEMSQKIYKSQEVHDKIFSAIDKQFTSS